MGTKVFPGSDTDELSGEFKELLLDPQKAVFYVAEAEGVLVGFAQCQIRNDWVEGSSSSPVGYLEGIYVEATYRKQGVASRLIAACEAWSRERACVEFASDCELENADSLAFHLAYGFTEVERTIHFIKRLDE